MRNYFDLTGKVALITGASSGIGAAAAEVFAELGARVALTYHNNHKGAEQVCAQLAKTGARAIAIKADVRNPEDIRAMFDRTTSEFGPIDILVNNAGSLVERQRIAEISDERWNEILNLNLTSAMVCSRMARVDDRAQIERWQANVLQHVFLDPSPTWENPATLSPQTATRISGDQAFHALAYKANSFSCRAITSVPRSRGLK